MRNYTTQMDAARKGIVTPELEKVAEKEKMTVEELQKLVAEGKVAICANKNHTCLDPEGRRKYAPYQRSMSTLAFPETVKTMTLRWKRS